MGKPSVGSSSIMMCLVVSLFVFLVGCGPANKNNDSGQYVVSGTMGDVIVTETHHRLGIRTLICQPPVNIDDAGEVLAVFKIQHHLVNIPHGIVAIVQDNHITGFIIDIDGRE